MEKRKRWQFFLIIAVLALTVYNILPTIFYYSKPLKKPVGEALAKNVSLSLLQRANDLEAEAIDWLRSFCGMLHLKPLSVSLDAKNPQLIQANFKNIADAKRFREYLPRAGSLISFVPQQLSLAFVASDTESSKTVWIQRQIPLHFDLKKTDNYLQFSFKKDAKGALTPLWKALVADRALNIGIALGGTSENGEAFARAALNSDDPLSQNFILGQAESIVAFVENFGQTGSFADRFFASFTQTEYADRKALVDKFLSSLASLRKKWEAANENPRQQAVLIAAEKIIKQNASRFANGISPFVFSSLGPRIQALITAPSPTHTLSLEGHNPFIQAVIIDWANEKIALKPYPDLLALLKEIEGRKNGEAQKNALERFLYNEIAFVSRETGEKIDPLKNDFLISLSELEGSQSFLAFRLASIAETKAKQIQQELLTSWSPEHADLAQAAYPVWTQEAYQTLPVQQQKLGLLIYAPALSAKNAQKGFRMNSIYVIARGMDRIIQKLQSSPESEQAKQFLKDFERLRAIMQQNGFFGYRGSSYLSDSEYAGDYIFEAEDYFQTLLKASREDFSVKGTKRYALLEFSDVEQRLLTLNKIETRQHEDLLKWRDDYLASKHDIRGSSLYDVPPTTTNVFWNNFKLSAKKYFRGDERKILHWGLDLSGGKTVQIELRDSNNRLVTEEDDVKQGINELYNRVNKMGVSEVSIRREGNLVTLDFPGSQNLSAAELVKASSMYFHIVNEKFAANTVLKDVVNRFLQDVWNEALVTNQKDAEGINLIAYRHLYGDSIDAEKALPRSESAKVLYENGLRLTNPAAPFASRRLDTALSKIAIFRGNNFTEWQNQSHPLILVFNNFALEGSDLENVQASYDPSKGNFLAFNVKGSQVTKAGQKISAREDLYSWTSVYSKEKISGTPLEGYTKGHGWRMAVILNGTIISAPALQVSLRDSAMITGSFTQREVNQLEADLKAGSLSFTPKIVSEKNVSPELGSKERSFGILATAIALVLVIITMVGTYRFAGAIASVAVICNLLIMWAAFQNIEATLTLANIAGLILTVAMAVDANVLVFERIREEFAISSRISSAVHAGYRKAFSAIIDSNITTIIAALILFHFDAGPIRGFAVTLIIGIVSSLFTALFMTRYFFAGWVQNPNHKTLTMVQWIKASSFDFLKHTKKTVLFSVAIIILGSALLTLQKGTLLGMDFTGGFAVNLELEPKPNISYRQAVEKALMAQGAEAHDLQVRELSPPNHIRIFLGRGLEEPGHPFYGLPLETASKDLSYPYEANPKLVFIVQALNKAGLQLTPQSLGILDKEWTVVSGQMSDAMRNNALIGLAMALLCILIYITIRFEFKYAISATICLAHDIIFCAALLSLLHYLGVPIQFDLNTVAALMTIIGYSLNDTIIVFDRIREERRLAPKENFIKIINSALNVTLSRTLMTSGITLLVLLPLVALGGSTIFGFALVMIIGVVFGTLSSLFIASPLMLFFHNREHSQIKVEFE